MTTSSSGTKILPPTGSTSSIPTTPPTPAPAPIASIEPSPLVPTATPPAAATVEALSVEVGKPIIKEGTLNPTQPTVFSLNLLAG